MAALEAISSYSPHTFGMKLFLRVANWRQRELPMRWGFVKATR
jgi:hypothetical protein